MKIILDWLGVATFRLMLGDTVVFLDAYMDRVPAAPPVGMSASEVTRADVILAGHSHFDHLAGAEVIAANTGARIIGSNETCRVIRERGIPRGQLVPSQGGERHRIAPDVTVRVFPGLHSCTWCAASIGFDDDQSGFVGLTEDERESQRGLTAEIVEAIGTGSDEGRAIREHVASAAGSRYTGGALAYLIETPALSILFQDTSGCWSGILRDLRPDVAILAAASRGNLDGEPFEGTLAQFVAHEAALLRPAQIVIAHHDDWMPPVTRDMTDISAVRGEIARVLPSAVVHDDPYLAARVLGS